MHPTRIQVFTIDGRKVFDMQIEGVGNLITLIISNLPEGLYIYKVQQKDQIIQTGKFLKGSF